MSTNDTKRQAANINLNSTKITPTAYIGIYELDEKYIGTADYLGVAFFWHPEYKHTGLREATPSVRRLAHRRLLAAGLRVWERSGAHLDIITAALRA